MFDIFDNRFKLSKDSVSYHIYHECYSYIKSLETCDNLNHDLKNRIVKVLNEIEEISSLYCYEFKLFFKKHDDEKLLLFVNKHFINDCYLLFNSIKLSNFNDIFLKFFDEFEENINSFFNFLNGMKKETLNKSIELNNYDIANRIKKDLN